MSILQVIINILIVSIPEEFFITMLVLFLLGRWELWSKEFVKENIKKIMFISVLPIAIITNLLKFLTPISDNIQLIISITVFAITIICLLQINKKREYIKIFGFVILALAIFMTTELITIFIATYGLKINILIFNKNPFFNFLIVIPERIMQYGFLLYIFLKKNSIMQINVSKIIIQNKLLRNMTILFTTIDMLIMGLMLEFIFFKNILSNLTFNQQLFIIIIGFTLIILLLLSVWIYAICIFPFEKYKQYTLKEEIEYEKTNDD